MQNFVDVNLQLLLGLQERETHVEPIEVEEVSDDPPGVNWLIFGDDLKQHLADFVLLYFGWPGVKAQREANAQRVVVENPCAEDVTRFIGEVVIGVGDAKVGVAVRGERVLLEMEGWQGGQKGIPVTSVKVVKT